MSKKNKLIKMTLIFSLATSLIVCSKYHNRIDIDERIPKNLVMKKQDSLILTSSSSYGTLYTTQIDGIDYSVVLDDASVVKFIYTEDQEFKTEEGIKIGTRLEEVINASKKEMKKDPGWAYYISLPSGWNAAFVTGETMTEWEPAIDSTVDFLFKR